MCIHFSICHKKAKTLIGHQFFPHAITKPIWDLVPPPCLIVLWLVTPPREFIMTSNKYRILELDYLPIQHPYFFLLTLQNSQKWKGWHHHNTTIRLIQNRNTRICLIPFTTKIFHITNAFWPEVIVNAISMNPLRTILPLLINSLS